MKRLKKGSSGKKVKEKQVDQPVSFVDRNLMNVNPLSNQFDSSPDKPIPSHKIMAGMQ